MNIERLAEVASSSKTNSINVAKLFAQSTETSNQIQIQRLSAQNKLFEERKKTYNAIKQSKSEQDNNTGILGKLLGTLGLGGLAKGLKGIRKPPSGGGGFGTLSPKPRPGLPGLGRGVAGLNLLFGGIDFMQRRSAGQSIIQSGIGAGAGVAGGIGGAALGAKIGAGLGTLVAPGVGTLIGGGIGSLVGGGIGAYAAGGLADQATGVDASEVEVQRRVQEEEKRTSLLITKTPFSGALDTFDAVLDKLAAFKGGICACAEQMQPISLMPIQIQQKRLQMVFEMGYNKGVGEGRVQGGAAGFVAGIAVVGGVLFLTRGRGGAILQRLGTASEIFEKVAPKTPKAPELPRTDPSKIRIQQPELPPAPKPTVERIMKNVFGEEPATPHTPRLPRNPKTGKPERVELVEEVIDTPEGKVLIRRPASRVEKETPEEFFQKQELKGIKKDIKRLKKIRSTLEPEEVPIGPQSMVAPGGSNLIALAEPNTTIVPVPVGGGTQIIGSGGATPYQAATKYAQMMSQITA